jgi:hypothetical protein
MPMYPISPKIRPDHLDRLALIYVRQSTPLQVREHTGSAARQYDLAGRARELGWPAGRVQVVDQDQGRSGASAAGRDGFQHLVAQVGLGRAGAVLSLEASRLARSCSDWYRLIEICALTNTLVIDEDGGKLKKASLGQLRFRPPTGLIYDSEGRIVFDPDEQVRHTMALIFDLFDQSTSARAVVQHFADHRLRCPTRLWGGARHGHLVWEPLSHSRVLAILHNPAYAGAYVYGRTKTRSQCLPGEDSRIKGRTRRVRPEDWPFLIPGHHPGYVTWEQFLRNQRRLDENRARRDEGRRGALREGVALLQGIARCGRCGRRMTVRYFKDGKSIPQIGWDGHDIRSHFDLSRLVCQWHPEFRVAYEKFLNESLVPRVAEMIEDEFRLLMTRVRRKLIIECLKLRQLRLAEVVG